MALTCYLSTTLSVGSRFYQYKPFPNPLFGSASKPIFILCNSSTPFVFPTKEFSVNVEKQEEEETVGLDKLKVLKEKIECLGISSDFITPGHYNHVICPKCKGGQTMESSLSLHMNEYKDFAMWRCFRIECGWAGQVFADTRTAHNGINQIGKVNSAKQLIKEKLHLEPLSEELIAYFAKRMISEEVLKKNAVMQTSTNQLIAYFADRMISKEVLKKNAVMQTSAEKSVIAFPYRRNGEIVNCKYRSITNKKYWQERGAEKILYGVDDIKEADEIIIVEGEIDKLSMDQAGILNCVSVPDGAPQKVSDKELPPVEKDTRFQYLWNCKQYLDKAPRIILATDSDMPGQVLTEELARRLGRERCWRVSWPKKDEFNCFKDANEVLKNLGSGALRDLIDNAQPY